MTFLNKSFVKSRDRVFAFMESIERDRIMAVQDDKFNNSYKMKMMKLNEEKEKCRKYCINSILTSMYKDALPISNDYKVVYGDELKDDIVSFITDNPMKKDYYVTDNYENSPIMKSLNEKVKHLTEKMFEELETNMDETNPDDIKFEPTSELDNSLQKITDDMGVDDVSNVIANNVQIVAKDEIERAKKEKETRADIEKQLANDLSITTKESVDHYLALHDLNTKKDFNPRLFQGIMIGKTKKIAESANNGTHSGKYLFNALESYSSHDTSDHVSTIMEEALLESIKDFTKLSMLKALKLEKLNKYDTSRLAFEYTQC